MIDQTKDTIDQTKDTVEDATKDATKKVEEQTKGEAGKRNQKIIPIALAAVAGLLLLRRITKRSKKEETPADSRTQAVLQTESPQVQVTRERTESGTSTSR
jgi:hypothetical protein